MLIWTRNLWKTGTLSGLWLMASTDVTESVTRADTCHPSPEVGEFLKLMVLSSPNDPTSWREAPSRDFHSSILAQIQPQEQKQRWGEKVSDRQRDNNIKGNNISNTEPSVSGELPAKSYPF